MMLYDHFWKSQLPWSSSLMPISGMILPGHMKMPISSMALRTSAVDSIVPFLFLLVSPTALISSSTLFSDISAMAPSRLKKPSSLHSRPVLQQTRLVRHSGMMLLVREDSTRMECTSLSSCTCSLPSYSNSGTSSPACCNSSSSFSQSSSIHPLTTLKLYYSRPSYAHQSCQIALKSGHLQISVSSMTEQTSANSRAAIKRVDAGAFWCMVYSALKSRIISSTPFSTAYSIRGMIKQAEITVKV